MGAGGALSNPGRRFGQTNVLAVHVDTRPHQSRWYPGAGSYRKVQLILAEPVHLAHWGTFVTTPQVGRNSATIRVEHQLENYTAAASDPEVETVLRDPKGLAQCVPDSAKSQLPAAQDVAGWNYARGYAISREKWPNLPIVYTESASAYSTRGYFDDFSMPARKDDYPPTARIRSYDHNSAYYSDPADVEFALMEQDRFVAGEFVWTGFDYIGEPVPLVAEGWSHFTKRQLTKAEESRISSFGIADLVGIPKDRFYLYRSHWAPEKATVHILPHWNWPERVGRNVPVYVHTSGDSAELFLTGTSLGKRTKNPAAGRHYGPVPDQAGLLAMVENAVPRVIAPGCAARLRPRKRESSCAWVTRARET